METEQNEIANRLKAREQSSGEISDARLEDLEVLTAAYEPPWELAPALVKVMTSSCDSERAVRSILLQLAEIQAENRTR